MGAGYALAYRVGLTPWERAGEAASEQLGRLMDREEHERTAPLGRALDIGCGTGRHTIELADRGWRAVGLDDVGRAVERARQRTGAASARFVVGDATDLAGAAVGADIDFFLDIGCFHGLSDKEREHYGHGVTAAATPHASLLMLAFRPGHRIVLPRGAGNADVERALPGWTIVDEEPADTSGMPAPVRRTAPRWLRLRRR